MKFCKGCRNKERLGTASLPCCVVADIGAAVKGANLVNRLWRTASKCQYIRHPLSQRSEHPLVKSCEYAHMTPICV